MSDRPQIKDFDWTLLAIVAAINLLGLLEIYSSTHASAMSGMHWIPEEPVPTTATFFLLKSTPPWGHLPVRYTSPR